VSVRPTRPDPDGQGPASCLPPGARAGAHGTDGAGRPPPWPCDLDGYQVPVGGRLLSLAEFLAACAHGARGEGDDPAGDAGGAPLDALRRALLAGGLPAVRSMAARRAWIQFGVSFDPGATGELRERLARLASDLLADARISNFFFMHKHPGMRLRFEAAGATRERLAGRLRPLLDGWRSDGVVAGVWPAVYEPEAHLFGGPVSMRSVHRLFTLDSLAWLGDRGAGSWALSLCLLRPLFTGLGVEGWEDRDVWDRVRWQTHRRLPPAATGLGAFAGAADGLRGAWLAPGQLRAQLGPEAGERLEEYEAAVGPEIERWRADYFETPEAYVGPREALAYYIVFHWNRARLPFQRQALLAEALARPEAA
jgi:thiopeptide-type bacteriocin biosynthesis protein